MAENPEDLIVTDAELRRQLPVLAKELKIGGSGSGIEEVSGTVTLDASGPAIREFFTTGATMFKANGADTPLGASAAVVWRRTAQGSWGYQVVQDGWVTPAATPDTTAPVAGTLAVTVTDVKADLSVSGASDDRGYVQYSFSKDNGATWTAYQDSASYSFTGLSSATAYQFRHRVKDAAGNTATGTAVPKTTNATPPFDPSDLYPDADVIDTFTGAADGTPVVDYLSDGSISARRTTEKGGLQWGLWSAQLSPLSPGTTKAMNSPLVNGGKVYRGPSHPFTTQAMLQLPQTFVRVEADYSVPAVANNFFSIMLAGSDASAIHVRVFGTEGLKVFRDAGTQVGATQSSFPLSGTLAASYNPADGKVTVAVDGVEKFSGVATAGYTGKLVGFALGYQASIDNFRVMYL